jgi:hypothetical protein
MSAEQPAIFAPMRYQTNIINYSAEGTTQNITTVALCTTTPISGKAG